MPKKSLPPPPGSKGRDLPPEPVYDDRDHSTPQQVGKRPTRPLPPQPSISVESTGPEQYEVVDIPKIPDQTYDDFESEQVAISPPPQFEQTTYDDFEVPVQPTKRPLPVSRGVDLSPKSPPTRRDWPEPPPPAVSEELYDDMDELMEAVPTPKHPGRRDPLPAPPQLSEETYDDWQDPAPKALISPRPPGKHAALPPRPVSEETYDEMEELPTRKALPVPISKLPAFIPQVSEEIYEECDEHDAPAENPFQDRRARAPSPEEIYDAPDEGEIYEDPGDEAASYDEETEYCIDEEDDEPGPPPLPNRPQAPKIGEPPIPSLPKRPTGGMKKTISQPPVIAAGLDLSQILTVKLKKVDDTVVKPKMSPVSRDADSHLVNWGAGLRKVSDSREDDIRKTIEPLQPPNYKLKKTVVNNIKVDISPPVVKSEPPKKAERPVKAPRNSPAPMIPPEPAPAHISVQVSPPVNLVKAPRKNSVPELDVPVQISKKQPLPSLPPTAIVRPERHIDDNSNEVKSSVTRSLPDVPHDDTQDKEQDALLPYDWYHGNIDRKETERRLRGIDGDGVFLVRKSKQGNESQPYTMTILYKNNIFTLKIRCRETDKKIALGEEKNGEMTFSSVPSLVSYHRDHNVILIGNPGGETKLLDHPRRV